MKIRIQRLPAARDLPLPSRGSSGSSGFDLRAAVEGEVLLAPGERRLIPTGIVLEIPSGAEGQVRPRSGLALRHGIGVLNAPGTIDSDYRGEVGVILINHGAEPFPIRRGDRIAQLVFARIEAVEWEELAETGELEASERGAGGYGSTGAALLALVTTFAFSLSACRPPAPRLAGAAAAASAAPIVAAEAVQHRVILVSLDGASSLELHRLYQRGELTEGGFERFFRDGAVSEGMIPVNPSLTSVNHISLATGVPADRTGIVGNTFHPHGAAWGKTVSGFATEIGAETLWEAAKRQGKRVGVTTWPGADATSERRRADWGMIYVNNPDRSSDLQTLGPLDWRDAEGKPPFDSRSPAKAATLASQPVSGVAPDTYRLVALDRTDDGKVNYDAVSMAPAGAGGAAMPILLSRGAWGTVPCSVVAKGKDGAQERRGAACPVKLLAFDPGLAQLRLYFGGVYPLKAYPEDFATDLERRGLAWPGPPNNERLEESWRGNPGIDLDTWSEEGERFTRFFGDSIRIAAGRDDWDLLMSYLPVLDEAGHELLLVDPRQAGYSAERKQSFAAARLRTWQAVDREIARLVAQVDLSRTTIVLVSDHGMSPVHTALDANVLLREAGLLAADADGKVLPEKSAAIALSGGGICHVYVAAGREDIVPRLREIFSTWRAGAGGKGGSPLERIATRAEAKELGLDSPNSGDLILFAREGYSFHGNGLKEGHAASPSGVYGMHGYLNHNRDIHAIYLALGAGVRKGDTAALRSTDVAGRVAAWLGMKPPGDR